jgi:anion-transporting  ArsA/GET3 family ATPase
MDDHPARVMSLPPTTGAAHAPSTDIARVPGPLAALLDRQRLIICVGSGGVGKTTMAAALGIAAARRGRRAAVLTIDPARRLQDALGIDDLGGEPHHVRVPRSPSSPTGRLDAMVLDAKSTFDGLIRRYAPTADIGERVLANRIYQSLSSTLAGSQEYMAMERMHEIMASARYDVLIVDTPPTQHALDFFEAPERLSALLSSRAAAILQNPSSILTGEGSRLAQVLLTGVLRGLERFTGMTLLRDLADFANGLDAYSDGFRARAIAVAAMLREPATSYLLVTTPEPARIAETLTFREALVRGRLPVAGVLVNRVLPASLVAQGTEPRTDDPGDHALARKLVAVQRRYARLVREERREIARLTLAAPEELRVEVPLRTREPASVAALATLGDELAG